MEMFNLNKLNDVAIKEQFQVKTSSSFAALENLNDDIDDDMDMNEIWVSIRGNMNVAVT
jgi:hypothetical protein